MEIPREVIQSAAKAQYEWQDGLPSWEDDADGFTRAEYVSQTEAAAQVIAEWARTEALREAVSAILTEDYNRPEPGVLGLTKSSAYAAGKRSALNAIRARIDV